MSSFIKRELTPRQREIAILAGHGLTNNEIADRLFLSPRSPFGGSAVNLPS
jgi:DNA-binding NarL/FixJ family response regulator